MPDRPVPGGLLHEGEARRPRACRGGARARGLHHGQGQGAGPVPGLRCRDRGRHPGLHQGALRRRRPAPRSRDARVQGRGRPGPVQADRVRCQPRGLGREARESVLPEAFALLQERRAGLGGHPPQGQPVAAQLRRPRQGPDGRAQLGFVRWNGHLHDLGLAFGRQGCAGAGLGRPGYLDPGGRRLHPHGRGSRPQEPEARPHTRGGRDLPAHQRAGRGQHAWRPVPGLRGDVHGLSLVPQGRG